MFKSDLDRGGTLLLAFVPVWAWLDLFAAILPAGEP